jgi:hypothetical protein
MKTSYDLIVLEDAVRNNEGFLNNEQKLLLILKTSETPICNELKQSNFVGVLKNNNVERNYNGTLWWCIGFKLISKRYKKK